MGRNVFELKYGNAMHVPLCRRHVCTEVHVPVLGLTWTLIWQEMEMDTLHGCTKCRFNQNGCGACRDAPIMERPKTVRWKPEAARPQTSVPSAPTFYPTAEEFTDPVAYINKIRPEGEK